MTETSAPPASTSPLLRMEDVDVGHARPALIEHAHWRICAGECWALVGANGAGKTTLLATLVSLRAPLSGTLNLAKGTRIGFISQRPQLASHVPLTVYDFVAGGDVCAKNLWPRLGRRRHQLRAEVGALLQEVGLSDHAEGAFLTLSEGMQQRAWVARALLSRPQLLILDEPTSAMDPRQETRTLALLARLAKQYGAALIVVGHHLEVLIAMCTHLAFIDANSRLQTGTRAQLEEPVTLALRPEKSAR